MRLKVGERRGAGGGGVLWARGREDMRGAGR